MSHAGSMTAATRGRRMMRESGYANGGGIADEASDKRMVERGVHEHESALHKGSPKTKLKLRRGGMVAGAEPMERPDRRARGGHVGKKGKVIVNINAAQKGDPAREQMAHQQGMQQGAQMVVQKLAAARAGAGAGGPPGMPPPGGPRPPMMPPGGAPGGPPMAGPPPGAMPPRPPMPPGAGPMARGGAMMMRDRQGRFTGGAV